MEIKNKIIEFSNAHKIKIYIFVFILFVFLALFIFLKINNEKKNILAAEKYVEAGLYLSTDRKDIAISIYEEIIFSDNKIYSILALNTVLEKNLISDNEKILEYFRLLNESDLSNEQKELITLKKALYLIKNSDTKNGMKLLNQLKNENSKFKQIIQDILVK
tara:strand:+ start:225 stop:710 length:486 start_codon:yes stop_codon:yes gene_type:complete